MMGTSRVEAPRVAWVLVGALAFSVALPALSRPALADQDGRVNSITPSCASVGEQATITGDGFGAENVKIAVAGVPAQVVAAAGHQATFVVPAGVPLGPTTVTTTNPGGCTGSIPFQVCDLLLPEPWAGTWKITSTYRNAATNSVTATDQITAFIRTGAALGLAPAAHLATCTGGISDEHLEVHCASQVTIGPCTVGSEVQIATDRTGETINGAGTNTITVAGICGPLVSGAQTIQIAGFRLSLNQDAFGPPTTLVNSFVPQASLLALLKRVPFATFNANVEFERAHRADENELQVTATFTLGAGSNGIDPLTEAVTLQVGPFSTTIPAGSFEMINSEPPGEFKFERVIAGVALEVAIRQGCL